MPELLQNRGKNQNKQSKTKQNKGIKVYVSAGTNRSSEAGEKI